MPVAGEAIHVRARSGSDHSAA